MIRTTPRTDANKPPSRHPSQNFITYLILIKTPVLDTLRSLDLPDLPVGYEEHLRNTMIKPPSDFDPNNRYHRESVKYLKDLSIYGLFHPDKFTTEAKSYLNDPDIKHHVEQLLLVRNPIMKPHEIAKKINAKFDTLYTGDGIDRYRHYFWNVRIMRLDDWSKIFNNPSEKSRVMGALRNSPNYTLSKLGFQQKIEIKEALRELSEIMYIDMQDWKHKPVSPEKTKALFTIGQTFSSIEDRLSNMDVTMKETLKQFERFRVEHIKTNITGIHDTAQIGNYSGSGMKLIEAPTTNDLNGLNPKDVQYALPAHEEEE